MLKLIELEDIPACLNMVKAFLETTSYNYIDLDEEVSTKVLQDIVASEGRESCGVVWVENERPVGLVIGSVSANPIIRTRIAAELCFWVEPEYRGGEAAGKLLEAYEYWAKLVGCQFIQVTNLEGRYGRLLDRWYKRKGYQPVEHTYLKEVL